MSKDFPPFDEASRLREALGVIVARCKRCRDYARQVLKETDTPDPPSLHSAILAELPIKPVPLLNKLTRRFTEAEVKDELARMLDLGNPIIMLTSKRVLVAAQPAKGERER